MTAPCFEAYALGKKTLKDSPINQLPWQKRIFALPSYHLILLLAVLVLIPHLSTMPLWLNAWAILMIFLQQPKIKSWLYQITSKKLKRFFDILKYLTLIVLSFFVWLYFNQSFGVEFAVGLLLAIFSSKICEFYLRRDGYILLHLMLFVLATAFLLRQDIWIVLLGLPIFFAILMGFIALNDEKDELTDKRFSILSALILPAFPMLVALFIFFPRIPPLWSLQMSEAKAQTGVSDTMSPGDFSELSQSTKLAFRVNFLNTSPNRIDMYWRGLVYEKFDGITWRQDDELIQVYSPSRQKAPFWAQINEGIFYDYQVILEPTEQHWLFALDYPIPYNENLMLLTDSFTLNSIIDVSKQTSYTVYSYPNAKIDKFLDDEKRSLNLHIPKGNDASVAFAQRIYKQSGNDPKKYIQEIQHYIQTQGFRYTLSPPRLHRNRIDEFLFTTKAGFCEHYASSFTFLMRAAGIPARVVGGYQGGEIAPDGKSWEVRQMDAHAWSEVWLENEGWVRVDPTEFVAPDRIEYGMSNASSQAASRLFGEGIKGQWQYQQFRFLKILNRYSDQISYYWQKSVVGFNQDKQKSSLLKWFNVKNTKDQLIMLIIVFAVIVGLFALWAIYKYKKRYHRVDLPLLRLSKKIKKINPNLEKKASEPYLSWLDRVGQNLTDKEHINQLKILYRRYRYGQDEADKRIVQQMKQLTQEVVRNMN